jgi:type II secretion system protein C
MAAAATNRFRNVLVLTTLALCAFFCAQGADATPATPRRAIATTRTQRRRDPGIILKRNIFDSAQGDLSDVPIEHPDLPLEDLPADDVETPCKGTMRLIGTVVLPGDLERSLAAIVGSDNKAGLHRGGAEVEGSRIRAIHSDGVVLQNTGATADRNAGLSEDEMAEGIQKVNTTNYNVSRSMLNKVLDNAGKIIGIAAVAPKMEGGQSIGMEIRGIRPGTLLTNLGIQNGDILESVNGQPLSSPDTALGAYTTLRTADKFNLSIRRGGQSMMINYSLQ